MRSSRTLRRAQRYRSTHPAPTTQDDLRAFFLSHEPNEVRRLATLFAEQFERPATPEATPAPIQALPVSLWRAQQR